MPDKECEEACKEAYVEAVKNCYRVLVEGLATAKTDEEIEKCKERFKRGMLVCKQAKQSCLEACNG